MGYEEYPEVDERRMVMLCAEPPIPDETIYTITCPICRGAGWKPTKRDCVVCNGRGLVKARIAMPVTLVWECRIEGWESACGGIVKRAIAWAEGSIPSPFLPGDDLGEIIATSRCGQRFRIPKSFVKSMTTNPLTGTWSCEVVSIGEVFQLSALGLPEEADQSHVVGRAAPAM